VELKPSYLPRENVIFRPDIQVVHNWPLYRSVFLHFGNPVQANYDLRSQLSGRNLPAKTNDQSEVNSSCSGGRADKNVLTLAGCRGNFMPVRAFYVRLVTKKMAVEGRSRNPQRLANLTNLSFAVCVQ
jgi:hypothetical protein